MRYALPATSLGFATVLVDAYLLKYATETLLIPPAWFALLIWLPRTWDAISDPLIGYLSDRTTTRWGRRRPWILGGALPMAVGFWAIWNPAPGLEGTAAVGWLVGSLMIFYTATTLVDIPHHALGAELCEAYDARTRLFGLRRILAGLGALGSVGAILAFDLAGDPAARRATALHVGLAGVWITAATVPWSVWTTPERPRAGLQARPLSPVRAFGDVLRNPHARLLLVVAFAQQGAVAALITSLPFYSDYVLETPGQSSLYILVVLLTSFAGVPIVLRVAPTLDKRTLMMGGMIGVALAVAALGSATSGAVPFVLGVAAIAGLAAAACDTVGPSLQADVIDYDEHRTGERKEAAYFALWALVAKLSRAASASMVALALAALEFRPNEAQPAETVAGLRVLTGWLPALLYGVGTLIFARYGLTRPVHDRIRAALDERRLREGSREVTP